MHKQRPIWDRMYREPLYAELVRFVGHAGVTVRQLQQKVEEMAQRVDKSAVESAVVHLCSYEGQFRIHPPPLAKVTLRDDVCKYAVGLLGLPPEHPWYSAVKNGEHIPYSWEMPEAQTKTEPPPADPESEEEAAPPITAGNSAESYARQAEKMNRRQLLCMLRDARKKLARHGKRSFSGKEAKKAIRAAEAELARRGLPIPEEGKETAEWDKKKAK
jgi:hypothetical protein